MNPLLFKQPEPGQTTKIYRRLFVLSRDDYWVRMIEGLAETECQAASSLDPVLVQEQIRAGEVDLIILDSSTIENSDGWLRLLREAFGSIKIVIITTLPDWHVARRFFLQGAADYLSKTDEPAALLRAIDQIIQSPDQTRGGEH